MVDLTFHLHDLILIFMGIFTGYALSRKQQGERVLPPMPQALKKQPDEPDPLSDDLLRCQLSEEEEKEARGGKIKTRT